MTIGIIIISHTDSVQFIQTSEINLQRSVSKFYVHFKHSYATIIYVFL